MNKIIVVLVGVCLLIMGCTQQAPRSGIPAEQNANVANANENSNSEVDKQPAAELFRVTRAIDGDTIELENGQRVRYIGIDAAEPSATDGERRCFASEATAKNKELVEGKMVRLEKDVSETDRYSRLLRYVYLDDLFINDELVKQGYAQVLTYPPDVKYASMFSTSEQYARDNKFGLWSKCVTNTASNTNANIAVPPIAPPSVSNTNAIVTPTPMPDNSNTNCVIKGNISSTGEKIYHIPGCGSYSKTIIDDSKGERWFCTESDALSAGWRKAKNCS